MTTLYKTGSSTRDKHKKILEICKGNTLPFLKLQHVVGLCTSLRFCGLCQWVHHLGWLHSDR